MDAVYISEGPQKKKCNMEDNQISKLFWDRDENAIAETSKKYGSYCYAIAKNILHSKEDSDECVNDTYWNAWNALPPHKPNILSVFLGKITRNLVFDRYNFHHAEKRGGGEIAIVLDEIAEIVSDSHDMEQAMDSKELIHAINEFLSALPTDKRKMFVLRYWYTEKVSTIAKQLGVTENTCSVQLARIRNKLRKHLHDGGFDL